MSAPASSSWRIWSMVALASDGQGVGHRLDADRRVAAHLHGADPDLAGLPALDMRQGRMWLWSLMTTPI